MGLVQRSGAAAGWILNDGDQGTAQVSYRVVAPGGASGGVDIDEQTLIADAFLQRCLHQAREVQQDVGVFGQRLDQGWIHGFTFRVPSRADWAYLMLWFPDAPGSDTLGVSLASGQSPDFLADFPPDLLLNGLAEVAALQTALRLDREHQHQRQQVSHYQHILRRLEHQLRHPLAMVHLYAANLHHSLAQDRDRQQAQTILDAVGHLSDQLTDLIAGCQRSQVQAEICSVPDLWAEAWQGLRLLAQATGVSLVLGHRPLTLVADRAQLIQVFTNLLHNALCFSPPQGQIFAQWQAFQREVVITLADQGPGLSPTDLQQMFRPYYSNRPQGSGLGLTIARQMVQQHGGKLWAENLPQGGAQFSLVLPLCPS
jgi:signal transduction histidine kinase